MNPTIDEIWAAASVNARESVRAQIFASAAQSPRDIAWQAASANAAALFPQLGGERAAD